jgi:ABC-type sugar transport system substrate-binding protein
MSRTAKRQLMTMLVGLVAALGIAACGSSSTTSSTSSSSPASSGSSNSANQSSGSSSSATVFDGKSDPGATGGYLEGGKLGSGIRPSTGAFAQKSISLGNKAGTALGKATLPSESIGIINFLNGIQSSDRLADGVRYASEQLGWKTTLCDGKGTPTQFVTCGNSLLQQGVKAIVTIAVEPGQMQSVVTAAKAKGIPVLQVGGGDVPAGFTGNYGPNEAQAGKLLSSWLLKKLDALPGNPGVVIHNYPAAWGAVRTQQFTQALAAQSKVKTDASVQTDGANLVQYTRNTVATQIQQFPSAAAYWFTFDTTGQAGGQLLATKYAGKTFPNRPLVVTFHADLETLSLMRQGDIDATSEVNYDAAVWEGIDALAEFFSRKTTINPANQPTYPGIGDPFTYQILTKANLPAAGDYAQPKYDIPSYFIAKWKAEFGV